MAISSDLRIGDVEVYLDFGDGAGEQFLGQTKGGAVITIEREFEDLTVDKYGTTPLDKALTGTKAKIKVMLAQPTTKNKYYAAPEGLYAASGSDSKVGIGAFSGKLMSTKQAQLRLHPRKNTPSSRDEDVYFWKVVSAENVEIPYKFNEQQVIEVTFEALADETQPDGQTLGRVGDATIS